jgi:serine/threonine-protein kinase HipA
MKLCIYGEIEGQNYLVGHLETVPEKEEQFSYDKSFMEQWPVAELSIALPSQTQPYTARKTRAFFRNLLPEAQALTAVARELEVSSASYLKILQALGSECIGAVTISTEESGLVGAPYYNTLSRDELAIHLKTEAYGMAHLQIQSRLSLAGAQSKMGLYVTLEEGRLSYSIPKNSAPSTHIIKANNQRFESLAENEYCCLQMAKACGFDVPTVYLDMIDENEPLLVIERFDRIIEKELYPDTTYHKVRRLHQEDFCQALGKLPEQKYEAPGQPYAKLVQNVLFERSVDPIGDSNTFAKTLVLNTILGNCDAHLKNFSLLKSSRWDLCALAPLYDIASTVVYERLDRHMAMKIGTTSNIDEVSREDFFCLAKDLRIAKPFMEEALESIAQGIHDNLPETVERTENLAHRRIEKLHSLVSYANSQIDRLITS